LDKVGRGRYRRRYVTGEDKTSGRCLLGTMGGRKEIAAEGDSGIQLHTQLMLSIISYSSERTMAAISVMRLWLGETETEQTTRQPMSTKATSTPMLTTTGKEGMRRWGGDDDGVIIALKSGRACVGPRVRGRGMAETYGQIFPWCRTILPWRRPRPL